MSTNANTYAPVYNEIYGDSLKRLSGLLKAYTGIVVPECETLKQVALDREGAETKYAEAMEKASTGKYADVDQACAALSKAQEAQRIRRDMTILSQGHKALMAGCLETMYRRSLKLAKCMQTKEASI